MGFTLDLMLTLYRLGQHDEFDRRIAQLADMHGDNPETIRKRVFDRERSG
jgi:hypothetical protein